MHYILFALQKLYIFIYSENEVKYHPCERSYLFKSEGHFFLLNVL